VGVSAAPASDVALDDDGELARSGEPMILRNRPRGVRTGLALPQTKPRLDDDAEVLLFRTAQETLRNVLAHSHARSVEVTLAVDQDTALLMISDDDRGFRPDDAAGAREQCHLGLRVLADMATNAGGRLALDAQPGAGRLRLQAPVRPRPAGRDLDGDWAGRPSRKPIRPGQPLVRRAAVKMAASLRLTTPNARTPRRAAGASEVDRRPHPAVCRPR
jgi:hypothetical protein